MRDHRKRPRILPGVALLIPRIDVFQVPIHTATLDEQRRDLHAPHLGHTPLPNRKKL